MSQNTSSSEILAIIGGSWYAVWELPGGVDVMYINESAADTGEEINTEASYVLQQVVHGTVAVGPKPDE